MRPTPTTYLFGEGTVAGAAGGRSRYGHTFGGPPDRLGASRDDCNGILIHLLHRLNLEDPAVPISIPGIKWLPLYYCFDFRANDLGYRLLSDERMETFFPEDDRNVSATEGWPDDNYPMSFPQSGIAVAPQSYDPRDPGDAYEWAGVFGIGGLSAADQAAVKRRVAEEQEGLGFYAPGTDEEYEEALSRPFPQGRPNNTCLNKACPNSERRGRLKTVALMPDEPVRGIRTFGSLGAGVDVIFQLCPECYTIRSSNQCT